MTLDTPINSNSTTEHIRSCPTDLIKGIDGRDIHIKLVRYFVIYYGSICNIVINVFMANYMMMMSLAV